MAYLQVKGVLAHHEATDGRFDAQQLQKAWKEYCTKQATYMSSFAQWWIAETLTSLYATWDIEYNRAYLSGDAAAEYYASLTKTSINGFITKALTHFFIDTSIFT